MSMRELSRDRVFVGYWAGVVLSEIGTRGTTAANLYLVYDLSGSVATTGLVGLAQGIVYITLSPIAGAFADRMNRRMLLQIAQGAAMLLAVLLAILTLTDRVAAWHVIGIAFLTTIAATFDSPTRNALVAAMVPRQLLPQAVALLNPSREIAVLVGPGLSGVLILLGGPGLVYVFDAITYLVMIVVLAFVRVPSPHLDKPTVPLARAILEGVRFVAQRRIIWVLMSLDLSAVVFGAYRVILPALALDILHVGPAGYGALSAAPSAGALLATYSVVRVVGKSRRLGIVLLSATVCFGFADIVLAQSRWFGLSLLAGACLGACDAMATSIRHATVQLETPDELRGRVNSIYQMASRGGPQAGDAVVGGVAGLVGPTAALTVGALVTIGYAAALLVAPNLVRSYTSHLRDGP